MSETRDPYDDQLRSARYKAERDQARQECERLQRKVECLGDDIENLKLELGEAKDRLRDSVPRDAYESRRTKWLRQIRECEEALHRRREYIKKLENAALERRTVRAEDREAAEWVRDHGGLDAVETRWDNDTQLADAVIYALWPYGMPDGGGNEDVMDELSKRLMPSGCEWPRFEDGARVKFGDVVSDGDETGRVYYVTFDAVNPVIIGFTDETPDQDPGTWLEVSVSDGKRVKRPAPKVLDADGVEIRVGDEVWDVETGCKRTVRAVNDNETVEFDGYENRGWFSKFLTHRAPVFAADGKPLREGETVYHVDTGIEYSVRSVTNGGAHLSKGDKPGGYCRADYLTHERPDSWERLEEDAEGIAHDISRNLGDWARRGASWRASTQIQFSRLSYIAEITANCIETPRKTSPTPSLSLPIAGSGLRRTPINIPANTLGLTMAPHADNARHI